MVHNVSNRQFLLALLFMLGSNRLCSQVSIKERVEIKPRSPVQMSTNENRVLFTINPDSNVGRHQEGAILVVYPCKIVAMGSIEIFPDPSGGYPPTDLSIISFMGRTIAGYMGYPDGTHGTWTDTATYFRACGGVGVQLWNTTGYDEVTHVTRSIEPTSATIVFEGNLLRYWKFKATATLIATVDDSYELESKAIVPDSINITQCQNTTVLRVKLRDKKGDQYLGVPCQPTPPPITLLADTSKDIELSYGGKHGKQLSLPLGDVSVLLTWNYLGESQNSSAAVGLVVEGDTIGVSIGLNVDKTVYYLDFESIEDVMHLMKTRVRVDVYECSFWGDGPVMDGTPVDLEIVEGAELGCLLQPGTGRQGKKLMGLSSHDGYVEAEYWANGVYPTERWQSVVLKATSGTVDNRGYFYVFPGDLIVKPGRSVIGYGDTTKIVLETRNCDETISPVPQNWTTRYQIVEADTIGYFYSPDSSKTGSPLIGQYPQARFYAKNYASPPDSVVVVTKVTAVDPNGGAVIKIVDGDRPVKERPVSKHAAKTRSVSQSAGGKNHRIAEEPQDLGEGSYYYGAAQVVVKKKEDVDHFKITLEKDTIAFTEASRIFVHAKDANDADIEFDAGKLLTMSVISNTEYGTFIDKNGDTLKTTPAKLDNVLYGDLKAGTIKFAAVTKEPDSIIVCRIRTALGMDTTKKGEKDIRIKPNIQELLLGETRYFYVKNENGELRIDSTSNAFYAPEIKEDVWGNEPVSIADKDNPKSGKRLGVYWEKKKPDGTALAPGMIRLIGRYWTADSSYQVNLMATYIGRNLDLTVKVKQPGRLGDSNRKKKDVFGKTFDMDSLIIRHAGIEGIPPQLLKGQIHKESSFFPSYRYEPYKDAELQERDCTRDTLKNNLFCYDSAGNTVGPVIPASHIYMHNGTEGGNMTHYPGFSGTIWHYYDSTRALKMYTEGVYKEIANLVSGYKKKIMVNAAIEEVTLTETEVNKRAHDSLDNHLENLFRGGLKNYFAQTRIVASYGFVQLLYYDGVYGDALVVAPYPHNSSYLPETINEGDTSIIYGMRKLKAKFKYAGIAENFESPTGWKLGYEETLKKALQYYNGSVKDPQKYAIPVYEFSELYPPKETH